MRRLRDDRWMNALWLAPAAVLLALSAPACSQDRDSRVIELPAEERALLDGYLGKGVVGKAIPGKTITAPLRFMPAKDVAWYYRITNGRRKGETVKHIIHPLQRDPTGSSIRVAVGQTDIFFLRKIADGGVELVTHQELDEGMMGSYAPPIPMIVKGMAPGDSRKVQFGLKVYYLNEPDHLKHSGSLDLVLTYVGAYEVTTPAGKYEANLLRSRYTGKIGPATVDDSQYRFIVEDVGVVCMIEKKRISALLLYRDYRNVGKVLLKQK